MTYLELEFQILKKRQERLYATVSQLLGTIAQGDNFLSTWPKDRAKFVSLLEATQAEYEDVSSLAESTAEKVCASEVQNSRRLFKEENEN